MCPVLTALRKDTAVSSYSPETLVHNKHYTQSVFAICSVYFITLLGSTIDISEFIIIIIFYHFFLFLNEVRLKCLHSTCLPIQDNQRYYKINRMPFDLSISNWLDECEFAKQCLIYLAISSHYLITCMEKSFQRKSKLSHFDCYDNNNGFADAAEPKTISSGISHIMRLEKS